MRHTVRPTSSSPRPCAGVHSAAGDVLEPLFHRQPPGGPRHKAGVTEEVIPALLCSPTWFPKAGTEGASSISPSTKELDLQPADQRLSRRSVREIQGEIAVARLAGNAQHRSTEGKRDVGRWRCDVLAKIFPAAKDEDPLASVIHIPVCREEPVSIVVDRVPVPGRLPHQRERCVLGRADDRAAEMPRCQRRSHAGHAGAPPNRRRTGGDREKGDQGRRDKALHRCSFLAIRCGSANGGRKPIRHPSPAARPDRACPPCTAACSVSCSSSR